MFFENNLYWMLKNFEDSLLRDSMIINKQFTPEIFLKEYFHSATDLDNRSLDILTYIILSVDESGVYHGTYDDLMTKFNISRATLATVLNQLQEKQFLTRTKDGLKISNKIEIPSKQSNIIIRFGNQDEGETKSLVEENLDKQETRHFPINESDFINFLKAIKTSKGYLSKELLAETNFLDIAESIRKYNSILKDEPISFYEYATKNSLEEEICEFIKIYENQAFLNPNNLSYIADNLSFDLYQTFRKYVDEIDSTGFSNETKIIMKEIVLDILKLNNFLDLGASFDNIRNILNAIYNNPQQIKERLFIKGVNSELVNSIIKKVTSQEGNCLRAYFNLKAETNIVLNYNSLKEILH